MAQHTRIVLTSVVSSSASSTPIIHQSSVFQCVFRWSTGNTGAVNRLFVEHRFTVQSDLDSTHNPRGAPVPVPVPYLHELFARIESRLDQLESGDEECRRFQQHLWRCCYAGCAGTKMVDQSTARDTVVLLGPGMPESRNVDRRPTIYGTVHQYCSRFPVLPHHPRVDGTVESVCS